MRFPSFPVARDLSPVRGAGRAAHPEGMSTYDVAGTRRPRWSGTSGRTPWLLLTVLLAALISGCSDGGSRGPESPAPSEPGGSPTSTASTGSPTDGLPRPMAEHRLDKLTRFLEKVELLDRIPPGFELRDVDYTSRDDAVAYLVDTRVWQDRGTIIATTGDNWAHSARLRISDELADLVDHFPLGQGAVGIKAQDQYPTRSYPPFVLYPDGDFKPLRVAADREPEPDDELLGIGLYNLFRGVAVDPGDNPRTDVVDQGLWAADVAAAEIFRIAGSPLGDVDDRLRGRGGAVMTTMGYRHGVGDGVWRFETSSDAGRSWSRTDVSLPLGHKYLWRYANVTTHAVGPGRRQAIAMSHAWEDLPLYMWELWWTDDEEEFRRVRLPWDRLRFGGMAFASDGALLLAEVGGSDHYCDQLTCNRPGRIWRLASDDATPKLLRTAPGLFGPFWAVGIESSGD